MAASKERKIPWSVPTYTKPSDAAGPDHPVKVTPIPVLVHAEMTIGISNKESSRNLGSLDLNGLRLYLSNHPGKSVCFNMLVNDILLRKPQLRRNHSVCLRTMEKVKVLDQNHSGRRDDSERHALSLARCLL